MILANFFFNKDNEWQEHDNQPSHDMPEFTGISVDCHGIANRVYPKLRLAEKERIVLFGYYPEECVRWLSDSFLRDYDHLFPEHPCKECAYSFAEGALFGVLEECTKLIKEEVTRN